MQQTFGKYRLLDRLAFGGMAEVFLATVHGEAGFSKPVVIKRLHPRLSEDHEFTRMLIDEARITSQLTHSNICQVLDLGQVDGSYFIAMEYVPGEDLRTLHDYYRRQRLYMPVQAAVHVVAELLSGLDYAHRKDGADGKPLGLIHRDISPQNLLISYEGEVKIIDFGIAKARQRLVQTQAGVIKGKFRYMSPEQAMGGNIDHRTDLFAAAVVLYELLRGEPHSLSLPDTEVLRRMREAEFDPVERDAKDVPRELLTVLSRALQRNPRKRFGSAAELRQALVALQPQLPAVFRGQGTAFGRNELAMLMKQIFPADRRRRRSGTGQAQPQADEPPARSADDATSGLPREALALPSVALPQLDPRALAANESAPLPREGTTPISSPDELEAVRATASARATAHAPFGRAPVRSALRTVVGQPSAEALARDASEAALRGPGAIGVGDPAHDLSTFAARTRAHQRPSEPPSWADESDGEALPDSDWMGSTAPREGTPRAPRGAGNLRGAGAYSRNDAPPPEVDKQRPDLRDPESPQVNPPTRSPRVLAQPPAPVGGESTRIELPVTAPHRGSTWRGVLLTLLVLTLVAGAFYVGRYAVNGTLVLPWQRQQADAETPYAEESPSDPPAERPRHKRWAQVRIESSPPGARVTICGKKIDRPTPVGLRLRLGRRCSLRLELEGYEPHEGPVVFKVPRPPAVSVQLRPHESAVPRDLSRRGTVVVTAIRVGTVFVNGVAMGQTPRLELQLNPGQYSIWINFPSLGIQTGARIVNVTVGEQQKLHFDPTM